MRSLLARIAFAILLLAAPAGRTEEQGAYDVRKAFVETDENGDGVIDRTEFIDRTVEVFYAADANKDGYLSPEEFDHGVVAPKDFTHADRNGDGRVSLSEFLWVRNALFDEVDTNGDGVLSLDEVVSAYETKVNK